MDYDAYCSQLKEYRLQRHNETQEVPELQKRYGISREFAQFLWKYTEHSVETFEHMAVELEDEILEIGCGQGTFTLAMALRFVDKHPCILATDISKVGLQKARELAKSYEIRGNLNIQFEEADATKLPYESGRFDWVVCPSVFEHIADKKSSLSEMFRVCKTGGRVVLSTDNIYGNLGHLSAAFIRGKVKDLLIFLRILSPREILTEPSDPEKLVEWMKYEGSVETFLFTHFRFPFMDLLLRASRMLGKMYLRWLFRMFREARERSKVMRGRYHCMFLVIVRKGIR